jgi:DNA-directed RNA polymerase subunit beta'
MDLLARIDLDELSYQLRHTNTETSKQRKTEALKKITSC